MKNFCFLMLQVSALSKSGLSVSSLLLSNFLLFSSCILHANEALTNSSLMIESNAIEPGITSDSNNDLFDRSVAESKSAAPVSEKQINLIDQQALSIRQGESEDSPYGSTGAVGIYLLAKVFTSLLIVIGCIFLISKFAQRFAARAVPNKDGIEILSATSLGGKERLLLVKVGEQKMLISSGAQGTQLVSELNLSAKIASSNARSVGSGFDLHPAKEFIRDKKTAGIIDSNTGASLGDSSSAAKIG